MATGSRPIGKQRGRLLSLFVRDRGMAIVSIHVINDGGQYSVAVDSDCNKSTAGEYDGAFFVTPGRHTVSITGNGLRYRRTLDITGNVSLCADLTEGMDVKCDLLPAYDQPVLPSMNPAFAEY